MHDWHVAADSFICLHLYNPHGPGHLELLCYGQEERMELFQTSNLGKRSLVLPLWLREERVLLEESSFTS